MKMEPNLPVKARSFWHIVREALFMLRNGISKSKIVADLHMMMKLGKITGKTIKNLMFHHSHHWVSSAAASSSSSHRSNDIFLSFTPNPDEYEFSCSNSPAYPTFHLPFHLNKRKKNHHNSKMLSREQESRPDGEEFVAADAVVKALKMLQQSETPSPALPGFGRSPMVRQVRITDSPFPLKDLDEDSSVNEAADNFIKRFYKDLRRQNAIAWDKIEENS